MLVTFSTDQDTGEWLQEMVTATGLARSDFCDRLVRQAKEAARAAGKGGRRAGDRRQEAS